jgi:hypothetical protein
MASSQRLRKIINYYRRLITLLHRTENNSYQLKGAVSQDRDQDEPMEQ